MASSSRAAALCATLRTQYAAARPSVAPAAVAHRAAAHPSVAPAAVAHRGVTRHGGDAHRRHVAGALPRPAATLLLPTVAPAGPLARLANDCRRRPGGCSPRAPPVAHPTSRPPHPDPALPPLQYPSVPACLPVPEIWDAGNGMHASTSTAPNRGLKFCLSPAFLDEHCGFNY
jgi:hypothetical protein